jgi:hypothetical protein
MADIPTMPPDWAPQIQITNETDGAKVTGRATRDDGRRITLSFVIGDDATIRTAEKHYRALVRATWRALHADETEVAWFTSAPGEVYQEGSMWGVKLNG